MRFARFFRFRLRTLLIGITLFSLVLGCYTVTARQYFTERDTILKLQSNSGYVAALPEGEHLFCGTGVTGIATLRWQGPEWLKNPLRNYGYPVFYRVEDLSLHSAQFDDSVIDLIANFKELERLRIVHTKITHRGCDRLRTMFPLATIEYEPLPERSADDPFR